MRTYTVHVYMREINLLTLLALIFTTVALDEEDSSSLSNKVSLNVSAVECTRDTYVVHYKFTIIQSFMKFVEFMSLKKKKLVCIQ